MQDAKISRERIGFCGSLSNALIAISLFGISQSLLDTMSIAIWISNGYYPVYGCYKAMENSKRYALFNGAA